MNSVVLCPEHAVRVAQTLRPHRPRARWRRGPLLLACVLLFSLGRMVSSGHPPPLRMSSAAARCSPKLSSLRTQHFGMLSGLLQTGAGTKRGRPRACACARGSNGRDASCERGGAEEQWLCGRQWPVGVRVQASGMRRGLRMNSSQGVSQPGFRRALDVTQRAGRASPVRVA